MNTTDLKDYKDLSGEVLEEDDDFVEDFDDEDDEDFFDEDYDDDDDYYPRGRDYDDDYDGSFYDPYSSRSPGICRGCPSAGSGCNACFHD